MAASARPAVVAASAPSVAFAAAAAPPAPAAAVAVAAAAAPDVASVSVRVPAAVAAVDKGKDEAATNSNAIASGANSSAMVTEDGKGWLVALRQARRDGDEERVAELRRAVQKSTDETLRGKSYRSGSGEEVQLQGLAESIKGTKFYDGTSVFGSFGRAHQTTAHFVKADVVDVALFLMDKKSVNPVVLVMADEKRPGGSYLEGTCAQEESIFRRSALRLNLEDPDQMDRERDWKYNLATFGAVYAPNVPVFRASEGRGYEFLPQPKKVSFICASSLVCPTLTERKKKKGELFLSDEDVKGK